MTGPVVVTGPTGNVGSAVVDALDRAGIDARAVDRDTRPRLDFLDPTTFAEACEGARGLFLLRPPPISRVGPTLNALVDAAIEAGVEHIVFLSVAGAEDNRIVPHHRVERHLHRGQVGWTILRPGFFAQNLGDAYRADIRDDDRLYVPAADGRVAFVDTRDLAEVAAMAFADPATHRGRGYTLTGPEALTFEEVATVLTDALDRPIRYEPASALGYMAHLRRRGLAVPATVVQTILHLGLRRGDAEQVDPTLERLLGRRPRDVETYVADHVGQWLTAP